MNSNNLNKLSLILISCFLYSCVNPSARKTNDNRSSTSIRTNAKQLLKDSIQLYSSINSTDTADISKISITLDRRTNLVTPIIKIDSFDDNSLFIKEIEIRIKGTILKIVQDTNGSSYVFNNGIQFYRTRYLSEMLTKQSDLSVDYGNAEYYCFENSKKIAIIATPERWSGLADSFMLWQIIDLDNRSFIEVVKKREW
ncbi:MAG TPA: hypothetical protein VK718_06070 [Ferruginibacter sp.]|jgi:hypothetical protein|nr:hypothetical protein [Ferruginibacter sp.]